MHGLLYPRVQNDAEKRVPLQILWLRDGCFDNRPKVWYTPNHFAPVIELTPTSPAQKSPTVDRDANPKPAASASKHFLCQQQKKRKPEAAELHDLAQVRKKVDNKAAGKRKFLPQWKDEFVVYHEDKKMMTCRICCTTPQIAGKTDFVAGCRTLKKETLGKHNVAGGHLRARDAGIARQKPAKDSQIAQSLEKGRQDSNERAQKEVEMKINMAYFIAKEELPFSKFAPIVSLQKKNGLAINPIYANSRSCTKLINIISEVFQKELADVLNGKKFMSIIIDGTTDAGKKRERDRALPISPRLQAC